MTKTFDQGREEIVKLCDYFRTNHAAFLVPGIKEAHVRQSLVDPLFEALGWDVANRARTAPQYREVIPEDSLEVEGQQKSPDYTFRVGTLPKFHVEAKKCGVNLHSDPAPAYQLRRYGWNARLAISILTDFEELAVYECTKRPKPGDKASTGRSHYFHFEEYPDRWRELWDIFSREAVWSGAFDQYAASQRARRGTSEVDTEFLKEIERWRDALAKNIALRNPGISSDDLNRAVQLTIDRVVFLRMAEDRGLEPDEQLLRLCERDEIYRRFVKDLGRRADDKYNSGLFHFQKEPGVGEEPDRITPSIKIDDKVFKAILQSLYFAFGSPYEFRVLPVEILGTVYERFLGKVIRLTPAHQAKVEEKPEVRKAGGVYYTPAFIVANVVENTVGKLIDGKSPAQLGGQRNGGPIRVLDMACGSGSFLLGAYQLLLNHCLTWYGQNDPRSHKKAIYQDDRTGQWRLTIEEKKRILTTHLFGVDIDAQAVEVSKLSLLLKVLEGENDQTVSDQKRLFQERALPNLAENIKCGNSLISPAYFAGRLPLDPVAARRVNAFDWKTEFPAAFRSGGFDCIIGNPPYIRIQTMKEWASLEVQIYKELYQSAREGNYDIYVVFVERGLELLSPRGRLGFICPHKFFNAKYGVPLRQLISAGRHLSKVTTFGDQQVFDGATTYTCLLFLDKLPAKVCCITKVADLNAWRASGAAAEGTIKANAITAADWNFSVGNGTALFARLSKFPAKLGTIADRMAQGIRTSANEVYVLDIVRESSSVITARSKILDRDVKIERKVLSLFLQGREIKPYRILPSGKVVIVPYVIKDGRAALIAEAELRTRFPLAHAYLEENKPFLADREK